MKKIVDGYKLQGASKQTNLNVSKTIYRNFVKEWHPDKFQFKNEKLATKEKSIVFVEAYHFLVSTAPETEAKKVEQYTKTTSTDGITDYKYKSRTLTIKLADGCAYKYFDVPMSIYFEMVDSDAITRSTKRHIKQVFEYCNIAKQESINT
jgi:curved DNA-binding protein CbpA